MSASSQGEGAQPVNVIERWLSRMPAEATTLVVLIVLCIGAVVYSFSLKPEPRIFPLSISVAIIVCALFRLVSLLRPREQAPKPSDSISMEMTVGAPRSVTAEVGALVSVASAVPLMYVFGLSLATLIFTTGFIRIYGQRTWLFSFLVGAITTFFIWWASIYFLRAASPQGFVIDWISAWLR